VAKLPIPGSKVAYDWYSPDELFTPDLTVYEDARVKNRAIGFIWPEEKRIILLSDH
jgi:hypothetical protein